MARGYPPDWRFIASIEVKKIPIDKDGELEKNIDTGTKQARNLTEFGVDVVMLVRLIMQTPRYTADGIARIQGASPPLAPLARLRRKTQIQELEQTQIGYATVGFGHLPGVPFEQLAISDFEGISPIRIDLCGKESLKTRRQEIKQNMERFFFNASNEATFDPTKFRPLFMFISPISKRWTLAQHAIVPDTKIKV